MTTDSFPVPAGPGLVVYAPPARQWWLATSSEAAAAYRCVCGATGTTGTRRGTKAAQELLADWDEHIPCSPHRTAMEEVRRLHAGRSE